ncbi:flagellar basal-body protein FlbY [Asticcacaulis sp. EMRT-3]|uniref:flagellar basal-body protein FlbY n=1 Tax=Asticcacaulis sp. EMRT-3 TaxID=3040349 RepID=UPI0024AF2588|nr:flagellar basal-body protein FlbY [Asticcacaulis sp. EMRT-3]MDI7774802.1 flagellar basal-body protein FlbY [Asticcacaulis sp. EMRT-3]
MALSAQNGSERARQLLALTVRLGERLERETLSLEAHRPQDIAVEVEETRHLSNLYRHESMRIKASPDLLDGMSDAEKTSLRNATELFQTRLKRYEHAVNAARRVTEGIITAVASDINAKRNRSATYGARGRTRDSGPHTLNFGGRV